jgi:SseB protein N-terminal domain
MRSIPDPGFAGDDGSVDPGVAAALAAYASADGAGKPTQRNATLAALQDARVLVPVVALLGEVEYDEQGLAQDKTSEMAAVLMTGRDGRAALLAFTSTATLTSWDGSNTEGEARPVPVTMRQAAQAAIQERAAAVLLDVAGPVMFVVEADDLRALALGHRLAPLGNGQWAWVMAPA